MAVDLHAHVIVPEALREAAPEEAWRPQVMWEEGCQVIEFGGKRIRSALRPIADVEGLLAYQERVGVRRTVISPWIPLLRYEQDVDSGLRWSRFINEGLIRWAQAYPDRLRVLGTVPLQMPEVAARELEELMCEPVVVGVEVTASVCGEYLGHSRFRPFWEAAEATGAVVFVHPTTRGFDLPVFQEHYLWNTVGNPVETTIAAAHLVMSGVLKDFPNLKVVLAHGGGALLCVQGRMDHGHRVQPLAKGNITEPPSAYLRRFYVDTVTHNSATLRSLVEWLGPDRVVLGSDYPFDMGLERPVDFVHHAGLTTETVQAILAGNLLRLLGPKGWTASNT